jgi:hypothetical protein
VVEPDSSVLKVAPRILAFVAVAIAVVAWFIAAPHLGAVSDWHAILIVSVGVLPGTLLLVYIALPLSRLNWSVLVAVALALVALACSQGSTTGWALAENFAKLWAAVFAGWAFLYLFAEVGLVVLIALLIPIVDAVSVFTPGAPTHEIVKHHISIYNNVAVAFLGPHYAYAQLGPPDILFYALFLGAALRFELRPGWTWLATTGFYAASFPIAVATHADGLPALPFLSAGFLLANGDLLWKSLRARRSA